MANLPFAILNQLNPDSGIPSESRSRRSGINRPLLHIRTFASSRVPAVPSSKPDDFRKRAEACRSKAQKSEDWNGKIFWVDLAGGPKCYRFCLSPLGGRLLSRDTMRCEASWRAGEPFL